MISTVDSWRFLNVLNQGSIRSMTPFTKHGTAYATPAQRHNSTCNKMFPLPFRADAYPGIVRAGLNPFSPES